jgi:hypothetical protein
MRAWAFVLIAGCGRIGFDGQPVDAVIGTIDAPPPCPPRPGLLFCESFEETPALTTTAGMVDIDATRAHRGSRSQHAQATGINVPGWQLGGVLPYVTSGDLYVRWHVYVPSTIVNVNLASVHLVEMDTPFRGLIYGFQDGMAEVASSEASATSTSTIAVPRDRWVCAQMHVVIADTGGRIEGALDEQLIAPVLDIDTLPTGGFRNVHAGVFSTALATEPMEMWTDELAIGTQPIPCD